MAFTHTAVRVSALAVGDMVAGFVNPGGASFAFPQPTAGGATYPSTVASITSPTPPPGASGTDMPYTIYLNDANYNNLPKNYTLNAGAWVIKATGTA